MSTANDLDPQAIERLRKLGGAKFTAEMIRLFLGYGAEKLAEARRAQQAADLVGVQRAVHPLKSSAGNVGAARMQRLASEAEQRAMERQAEAVAGLLDELERAYQTVRPLLEAECPRQDPSSTGPVQT
jgi:HPt (histidine-containing phosphotransfer) domain-containing protein